VQTLGLLQVEHASKVELQAMHFATPASEKYVSQSQADEAKILELFGLQL
jgi:hypothetical protein